MNLSDPYINDCINLPTANHSGDLSVPKAISHIYLSQEEVYEPVGGLELEASQKHESGKFSRS